MPGTAWPNAVPGSDMGGNVAPPVEGYLPGQAQGGGWNTQWPTQTTDYQGNVGSQQIIPPGMQRQGGMGRQSPWPQQPMRPPLPPTPGPMPAPGPLPPSPRPLQTHNAGLPGALSAQWPPWLQQLIQQYGGGGR